MYSGKTSSIFDLPAIIFSVSKSSLFRKRIVDIVLSHLVVERERKKEEKRNVNLYFNLLVVVVVDRDNDQDDLPIVP